MIVRFGLELHEQVYPDWDEKVDTSCGEKSLLILLEEHLGLGYPENQSFLRVEQYRQILQYYKEKHPEVFYAQSFEADALATASALLDRRDELYLARWDFKIKHGMPLRLKVLAELEQLVEIVTPVALSAGFAERFVKVMRYLEDGRQPPLHKIILNEPFELLPPHWQQMLQLLQKAHVQLETSSLPSISKNYDLAQFQKALLREDYDKGQLKKDGSLIILQSKSEAYAATYLAQLFKLNTTFQPLTLLPDKNRALDNALIQEGMPSFGVQSASLARPTLQILKLVSAFLWKPLNPYKLLEFVSLPNKPIHDGLARTIAAVMAKKPGMFSESWKKEIFKFFNHYDNIIEQEERKRRKKELQEEKEAIEKQYDFWFRRRRFDIRKVVPVREVVDVFEYVQQWAMDLVDENKSNLDKLDKKIERKLAKSPVNQEELDLLDQQIIELQAAQPPLLMLFEQSRRIVQVLEALPENEQSLSYLQLERLVKTINEPVPMHFRHAEVGHIPFVYHPSAITESADSVLWWNFIESGPQAGFTRWYKREIEFLDKAAVQLEEIGNKNQRILWQRMQPALQAKDRLMLVLPDTVGGQAVNPHPLWGDLHAIFGGALQEIIIELEEDNQPWLAQFFDLPGKAPIPTVPLNAPQPYIHVKPSQKLTERFDNKEEESFTSLENLFYFPYQWVFKYLVRLHKSSILSVVQDKTLMGNLAHTIMQHFLEEVQAQERVWNKEEVEIWIDEFVPEMFEREGAVLLLYGREAERVGFVNKIKHAAWSLLASIQENGWTIEGIELKEVGLLADQPIKGTIDLVLKRGDELAVVDLKWRGKTYFRDVIRNKEDLQLVIYSRLVAPEGSWAHTSYYIMSNALLIARNNLAFKEAEAIMPDEDHETINKMIWESMEATYQWRMQQIQSGQIEIRNEHTTDQLDQEEPQSLDMNELMALLEMSGKTPGYDIYKVLVGNHQ